MTRAEMETRRLEAIPTLELLTAGKSGRGTQARLAESCGVSRASVSKWLKRVKAGQSMELRRATGRPTRLTAAQFAELSEVIETRKWSWSNAEFAGFIRSQYGVAYHPDHAGRILHRLGGECRSYLTTRAARLPQERS